MFPKPTEQSRLPTLSINAVDQDEDNYVITYSGGVIQSFEEVNLKVLLDDVEVSSTPIGLYPVQATLSGSTVSVPGYAKDVVVKLCLESIFQTTTSTGFTSTYDRFSGTFPSLASFGGFITNGTGDTYDWGFDASPFDILSTDNYSNMSATVKLESRTTSPPGSFVEVATRSFTIPNDENLWYNSSPYVNGPKSSEPDEGRVTLTVNVAGYSTSASFTDTVVL